MSQWLVNRENTPQLKITPNKVLVNVYKKPEIKAKPRTFVVKLEPNDNTLQHLIDLTINDQFLNSIKNSKTKTASNRKMMLRQRINTASAYS